MTATVSAELTREQQASLKTPANIAMNDYEPGATGEGSAPHAGLDHPHGA